MTMYTETDIRLAMTAHSCSREEAIENGYAEKVAASREEMRKSYEANLYRELRKYEYPPITEYLDGIVKGDQAQVQAYIDACLAVKEKYPKPQ